MSSRPPPDAGRPGFDGPGWGSRSAGFLSIVAKEKNKGKNYGYVVKETFH